MRALLPAIACLALASCGPGDPPANQAQGGTAVENATLTQFSLTSDAFEDGQAIPVQFTCDGHDEAPRLNWGDPPDGTKSFAIIIDDPDAPSGTFRHWGAYNIPASARSLDGVSFDEVVNDFGKPGYGGPCPPPGHGVHHYRFKLFALGTESLSLPADAKVADLEREAGEHILGRAELTGTFERR
jgi:Raf kinase inhibitor-like YbhB/YbcL family protein